MTKEESALALWRDLINDPQWSPFVAQGHMEDMHCVFCSAWEDYEDHEPTCTWLAAVALVGQADQLAA
jgi:hypothetical protein